MEQFTLLPSVQSNIQVAGMLPAATQNRHERQLIYFQRQSPAAQSFCCHSLVLSLSSTQQHSATWVKSYWYLGKGKKKKKEKKKTQMAATQYYCKSRWMRDHPWLARLYVKLALQVKKQNKKVRNDNKKEREIRSASTSVWWWWMLMQWLWNWQKPKPKTWTSSSTWQAKATFWYWIKEHVVSFHLHVI